MSHPMTGTTRGGLPDRLDRLLADLLAEAPQLQAAAVVSFDGLAMASLLPAGMDEDRVAAMSAALLTLGEKAAEGLGRGDLAQVWIEGDQGTVFLVSAEDEAVLVAVAEQGAKAGLMLYEVRRAAAAVADALRRAEGAGQVPLFEQLLEAAAARPYPGERMPAATLPTLPTLPTSPAAPTSPTAVPAARSPDPPGDRPAGRPAEAGCDPDGHPVVTYLPRTAP